MGKRINWKKWSNRGLIVAAALLLLILMVWGITGAVSCLCRPAQTPDEPPVKTVWLGGQEIPINEDIAVNAYDKAAFTAGEDGRVHYGQALCGIDVSSHQGEIDWQAVKADGIDFVILRMGYRGTTEGGLYTDARFLENLEGAAAAGLGVGVYFFSQAISVQEAREEADHAVQLLQGHPLQYPVFFDWEPSLSPDERTYGLENSAIGDYARVFCQTVEAAGYKSGLYFNSIQGYLRYDLSAFEDVCLWLAEYDTAPEFYYDFQLWQYSCSGSVQGIQGAVDMNLLLAQNEP